LTQGFEREQGILSRKKKGFSKKSMNELEKIVPKGEMIMHEWNVIIPK
jgi:hypothetical protein